MTRLRRPKGGAFGRLQHRPVKSGKRWLLSSVFASGALQLAACGGTDTTGSMSRPVDLPSEVADLVYTGRPPEGRAIAFVRDGRLFVVAQDRGILFALEPAHGDTPPLVLAVAQELVEPSSAATAVALADMKFTDPRID